GSRSSRSYSSSAAASKEDKIGRVAAGRRESAPATVRRGSLALIHSAVITADRVIPHVIADQSSRFRAEISVVWEARQRILESASLPTKSLSLRLRFGFLLESSGDKYADPRHV
ncbi:hypothetical protein CRG98_011195, partial [Punica granatum]